MVWGIVPQKAEDLAIKLGHTNFVATEGWLSCWRVKHQISYKQAHGEKGSADIKSVTVKIFNINNKKKIKLKKKMKKKSMRQQGETSHTKFEQLKHIPGQV